MVFVSGRVMGQVPLRSWPAIVKGAREKAGDMVLIADGYQAGYARMFDGIHTHNICDWVQPNRRDRLGHRVRLSEGVHFQQPVAGLVGGGHPHIDKPVPMRRSVARRGDEARI